MSSMIDGPAPELKILIAEGPWGMKEVYLNVPIKGRENELGYDVVVHKCKWKDNWFLKEHDVNTFIMLKDDPYCPNCKEPVPNMFKTLWTLKNFDKIQDSAEYGTFGWGDSSFYMTPGVMNMRPGQLLEYTPLTKGRKSGSNWFYVPTPPRP